MSKKCSFCNKWLVAGKCSVCPKPVATVVEEEVVESQPTKAVETTESQPKVESNEKVDYESNHLFIYHFLFILQQNQLKFIFFVFVRR